MRVKNAASRAHSRPTNVTLSAALVAEAKTLGINISAAAAAGLEEAVAKRRSERWLQENAEAIESFNAYVEKNGLPLEKSRLF